MDTLILELKKQRLEASWAMLASQPSWIGNLKTHWETPSQERTQNN